MLSKLTVILYILLCFIAGIFLTVLPWFHPFGLGDWADNYFLLYASQKTGLHGLQKAVASGWVRGAVTGLGLINLALAFWETAHFHQSVRALESQNGASQGRDARLKESSTGRNLTGADGIETTTDDISNHGRRNELHDHAGER